MRRFFSKKLHYRLAIVFVVASTIPLGIVGGFSLKTADRAIGSIVANQLENVAADKQDLLQRWMAERMADIAVVARSQTVRSLEPERIASYLRLMESQYQVYRRFVVMSENGKIVHDTVEVGPGSRYREPWYEEAMKSGLHISQVQWSPERQEAVFQIAEAIPKSDGGHAGVVCATVSTQAILADVLKVSLGETGECYLVDRTGAFLAHKQPERILTENIAQSGSFANLFSGSERSRIYTDYRGIAVLGASRAVVGTPWFVVVEQDWDEAFAPSRRLAWQIAVAVAATVLCAIALSWGLAAYLTLPVRRLSEAADSLSRGDFPSALVGSPSRRTDELGVLDAAFRHMAGQLFDRHQRMQRQIGITEEELRRSEARLKETLLAAARSERLAALGRLAAGVAHEVRTPLTSLKLFLQSAREDLESHRELVEDLEIAMRQIGRMESTINHFLQFARPQEPRRTEVDFSRLVEESLLVVQPRANQQGVKVASSVAANLPNVEGDVRQLGESLVNLLVNALEAMPDGGGLSISVSGESDGATVTGWNWVRIEVSDTGPGIPENSRNRLFEPFFTTKATGSGLGLAIVQGTIDRHGGTISVDSRPGCGTTFRIRLPARDR